MKSSGQHDKYKSYIGFTAEEMHPRDYYGSSPSCLFKEVSPPYTDCAMYTMEDYDKDGLISARHIFMACNSEYEAAMKLVGSWQGWLKIARNVNFLNGMPNTNWGGLKEWREEMKIRDQAEAKIQLMKSAKAGNVSAQRAMYEQPRTNKPKATSTDSKIKESDRIVSEATERLRLIKR